MAKTKEVVKKVSAKTPAKKVVVSKKEVVKKAVAVKKPNATLVSYSIKATIPVGSFANIIPEITVNAKTLEDAAAFVLPYIESLFDMYAEDSRDGRKIKFLNKASVTVQERVVAPAGPMIPHGQAQGAQNTPPPSAAPATIASAPNTPSTNKPISFEKDGTIISPRQTTVEEQVADVAPLPEKTIHYQKAENAVHNSFTIDALDLVQSQITASVKLDGNEKNHLYTLVLKKRAELNNKL